MSMEQDVGLLQGEMKALQHEMREAKEWLKEISDKQSATNILISEAFATGRGTWKTLATLGSIAVTLGGIGGWLASHFKLFP